jgi:hypothetical protein
VEKFAATAKFEIEALAVHACKNIASSYKLVAEGCLYEI